MSKKLNIPQLNKEIDMERIKKENPMLYTSIQQKHKALSNNKIVRK